MNFYPPPWCRSTHTAGPSSRCNSNPASALPTGATGADPDFRLSHTNPTGGHHVPGITAEWAEGIARVSAPTLTPNLKICTYRADTVTRLPAAPRRRDCAHSPSPGSVAHREWE